MGASENAFYTVDGSTLVTSPATVTYTYNGPQLASVQTGTTTYASYSGFNALGQPSTLTLGNGTTTTYTCDTQNYRLKTVQSSMVLQDLGYMFDTVATSTRPHAVDWTGASPAGYDNSSNLSVEAGHWTVAEVKNPSRFTCHLQQRRENFTHNAHLAFSF